MSEAALFGLILTGGRSRRMGRDKAALELDGRTALQRAWELAEARCEQSYVSVSPAQRDDPLRAGFPRIVDRHGGSGPADGILSAQLEHPQAAWLVIACDLPLLDGATLDMLIEQRDRDGLATAYTSTHDGLPEPLCAIYEPASHAPLAQLFEGGLNCPRRMLMQLGVRLLEQSEPGALDNVNTPSDLESVRGRDSLKTLEVEYFALFRERAGVQSETVRLDAGTPAELFSALGDRHAGLERLRNMKVAVNDEMAAMTTPLREGDRVLFFPPVSGG